MMEIESETQLKSEKESISKARSELRLLEMNLELDLLETNEVRQLASNKPPIEDRAKRDPSYIYLRSILS